MPGGGTPPMLFTLHPGGGNCALSKPSWSAEAGRTPCGAPLGTGPAAPAWIATYAALSTAAGLGWVMLGSLLPLGIRRHAYKLASIVLGGFSLAAIASVANI